jgi:hypothetical protein
MMRYCACLTFLIVASVSLASAQSKKDTNRKLNKAGAELMQLERDIGAANVRRDKAFFERLWKHCCRYRTNDDKASE